MSTTAPAPDLQGYGNALERLRSSLGSTVTFYWNPAFVWPGGTSLDPSGQPYDPTVEPAQIQQASYTTTAAVTYRQQLRNTDAEATEAGWVQRTQIMLNLSADDEDAISSATTVRFHGDLFQIHSVKRDEILGNYTRILVYAAGPVTNMVYPTINGGTSGGGNSGGDGDSPVPGGDTEGVVYAFTVPAVEQFTIQHNLGRYPVGPTFYDQFGNLCDVQFMNTDPNTLQLIKDDPTPGTVMMA